MGTNYLYATTDGYVFVFAGKPSELTIYLFCKIKNPIPCPYCKCVIATSVNEVNGKKRKGKHSVELRINVNCSSLMENCRSISKYSQILPISILLVFLRNFSEKLTKFLQSLQYLVGSSPS